MIAWHLRSEPLAPVGVAGSGEVARRLGEAALRRDDAALASLRAVAGDGLLVILGQESALPWVDGALYLGNDPRAPSLLLSTLRAPSVPLELFQTAAQRKLGGADAIAVIAEHGLLVPLASARPIARDLLCDWLAKAAS